MTVPRKSSCPVLISDGCVCGRTNITVSWGKGSVGGTKRAETNPEKKKVASGFRGCDSSRVCGPDVMMLLLQAEQRVRAEEKSFHSISFHIFSFKNNINHK